ncbi:MAG: HD domain-containing protein [Gemmatimonadales bacterium]|nr:HD domain-containing protein [Gemmatimonadota bacterium]MCL4213575.1 HD domain-containing protein [Gemmatimonadales bacterium]
MTGGGERTPPPGIARPSVARDTQSTATGLAEGAVRRLGRTFVLSFYVALRNLKLYPVENAVVQKALEELAGLANELLAGDGECEFRLAGEFLFLNSTRMKLDLDNYTSFSYILGRCREAGVGSVRFTARPAVRDWTILLSFLSSPQGRTPDDRYETLLRRMQETGVTVFEMGPQSDSDDKPEDAGEAKERAKRTYAQSVSTTKEVINSVRMGQSPNTRKIKRVVQGIVDQILAEETSLMGLTTIRDYDDYTFTHCVNVCIFSVALGRRLGLTRLQLYDLGFAGLFHDIGKSRVPIDIIQKPDMLTEDEWRLVAAHPWLGVLALFQLREQSEFPYRSMLVAYQHHMKRDLTGYPRSLRMTEISFYSKIVAVADGFDAATTRRVYNSEPMDPATVLQEMRDNPRRGMDPVVVKAFVALLGIYPVGTFVVLDTFELAIVHGPNPIPEMVSRPLVRIVSDSLGNVQYPGDVVDLAETDAEGNFRRTIIKTGDPEKYGIRVGDFFL